MKLTSKSRMVVGLKFFAALFLVILVSNRRLFFRDHVPSEPRPRIDEEKYFRNPKGLLVHFRQLAQPAASQDLKGVVIFVHGYAEHLDYYEAVAEKVSSRLGLAGYGLDHVGHGASEGERCYVVSLKELADDVFFLATKLKRRYPDLPLFIYGHSMGGAIAIITAQMGQEEDKNLFKAAFLEAPLIRVDQRSGAPIMRTLARLINFMPKLRVPGTGLDREKLTHNNTLRERWSRDKKMCGGPVYVGTGNAILDGEEYIDSVVEKVEWPFMVVTGDDDVACDHNGAINFHSRASSKQKRIRIYPNQRHTLKHDIPDVAEDCIQWFQQFLDK